MTKSEDVEVQATGLAKYTGASIESGTRGEDVIEPVWQEFSTSLGYDGFCVNVRAE